MRVPKKVEGGTRRKGASGMEFGILVGLVAVVAVAATATVGGKVREIFGGTANAVALGMNGSLGAGSSLNLAGGVTAPTPPSILTASLPTAAYGSAYAQALSAAGQNGDPVSWSFLSGGLPAGLLLNGSTGAVTGAPSALGSFPFVVRATDTVNGLSSSASLSVSVAAGIPAISTASLPAGANGAAYSQTISGSAAPAADGLSWALASGTLPAGILLAPSTGVLSGTPTSWGTSSFSVRATDAAAGTSAVQALSISVAATAPLISTASLAAGQAGTAYSQTLAGTDPQSLALVWGVGPGTLPSGITLAPSTGVLSGTPAAAGTYTFTVSAADAASMSTSKSLSISVAAATLYGGKTATACTSAGGTVISIAGASVCKFVKYTWPYLNGPWVGQNYYQCATGWTPYQNWTTTIVSNLPADALAHGFDPTGGWGSWDNISIGGHSWSNTPIESGNLNVNGNNPYPMWAYATEAACY